MQAIANDIAHDVTYIIDKLKHYLPAQAPIKDFIHHNTLHAFQYMKFFEALNKAEKIFGYQTALELQDYRTLHKNGRITYAAIDKVLAQFIEDKEERLLWKNKMLLDQPSIKPLAKIGRLRQLWQQHYSVQFDNAVHPILFRLIGAFLDQGVSEVNAMYRNCTFIEAVRQLHQAHPLGYFHSPRVIDILMQENISIDKVLEILVGDASYGMQYIFDQQFSHHGWSGIIAAIEAAPYTLREPRRVTLHDFILVELLFEIDTLDRRCKQWKPIQALTHLPPIDLFEPVEEDERMTLIKYWQSAFEWSYYDEILSAIILNKNVERPSAHSISFQSIFCIDERECSIRRHLEAVDLNCETYGAPGFFGVEFYYKASGAAFSDKLCPAPVFPKFIIHEQKANHYTPKDVLYTQEVNHVVHGIYYSLVMGFWSFIQLIKTIFFPKMSPAISDAFAHMDGKSQLLIEHAESSSDDDLTLGYTIQEMAIRVEQTLRGIGLIETFAPFVYVVAHGSSSANNPHHSAHDCGACSGKPGSVNSRIFAYMANKAEVRALLIKTGINIPHNTLFIGALHDTAADKMAFYDTDLMDNHTKVAHQSKVILFEKALDMNASERARRFASISNVQPISSIRKAIADRSVTMHEPRPELGHGTNAMCIVGRRSLSKGVFLDRRSFLNSYDWTTDLDGKILTNVIKPIGLVCGGINLEYYFSRVDNIKLGAGTKLPHNVMGLIGVANSSDGDLRSGLPWQMIEVHDPVRLLVIVEHKPDVVLTAISANAEVYEWYKNEWVHIMAYDPEEKQFYYFKNEKFTRYNFDMIDIPMAHDLHEKIQKHPLMVTNHITDATKENMPVYLLPSQIYNL